MVVASACSTLRVAVSNRGSIDWEIKVQIEDASGADVPCRGGSTARADVPERPTVWSAEVSPQDRCHGGSATSRSASCLLANHRPLLRPVLHQIANSAALCPEEGDPRLRSIEALSFLVACPSSASIRLSRRQLQLAAWPVPYGRCSLGNVHELFARQRVESGGATLDGPQRQSGGDGGTRKEVVGFGTSMLRPLRPSDGRLPRTDFDVQ